MFVDEIAVRTYPVTGSQHPQSKRGADKLFATSQSHMTGSCEALKVMSLALAASSLIAGNEQNALIASKHLAVFAVVV